MRALLIPCVALCSLGLSGCHAVYSANSLSDGKDSVEEPSLAGQWTSTDSSDDSMCILKSDQNTYTMIVSATDSNPGDEAKSDPDSKSDKPSTQVETFRITLVRLQNQLFADMVADQVAVDGTKIEPPVGAVYHHIIVKLDFTDSDLAYYVLDTSAIREANTNGYATLPYLEINDGILLTASTEDLRWSVSHFADRLFVEGGHYTRATDYGSDRSQPSPCGAVPPS